jgi:hypothetical protein
MLSHVDGKARSRKSLLWISWTRSEGDAKGRRPFCPVSMDKDGSSPQQTDSSSLITRLPL